jgi:hypothetical protein
MVVSKKMGTTYPTGKRFPGGWMKKCPRQAIGRLAVPLSRAERLRGAHGAVTFEI